jgi:hypothetical protein
MIARRLFASLPFTVTGASKRDASLTNSAAGRAWRPSLLTSSTERVYEPSPPSSVFGAFETPADPTATAVSEGSA